MPIDTHINSAPSPGGRVKIHYIKSNFFRVVHADGVTIEVNGSTGEMHLDIFNQRSAIPQQISLRVNEDGTFGTEIQEDRIGREGYVREVEVQINMSADVVQALMQGLQQAFALLNTKPGGAST